MTPFPRVRSAVPLLAALTAVLLVAGCGSSGSSGSGSKAKSKGKVTIGAFNFGESQILAHMYADVLNKAGYQATVKSLTTREVVEPALERNDIQVVPEYLSTLTEFLNGKANGPNAKPLASPDKGQTLAALKTLAVSRHIVPLTPSDATDENSFAVTQAFASAHNLTKTSDLSGFTGKLVLGGPPECPTRPFCEAGLVRVYGIHFTGFKALDTGGPLTKTAIKTGKVQIGLVFSSDGGIDALGLKVLEDDKHLQNTDNVIPVVNSGADAAALEKALNGVSAALTTDDLVKLNKMVDIDRDDPDKVAKDFLQQKNLL